MNSQPLDNFAMTHYTSVPTHFSCVQLRDTQVMVDPGFPRGANSRTWGCQPIIWAILPENYMKMKDIKLRDGVAKDESMCTVF